MDSSAYGFNFGIERNFTLRFFKLVSPTTTLLLPSIFLSEAVWFASGISWDYFRWDYPFIWWLFTKVFTFRSALSWINSATFSFFGNKFSSVVSSSNEIRWIGSSIFGVFCASELLSSSLISMFVDLLLSIYSSNIFKYLFETGEISSCWFWRTEKLLGLGDSIWPQFNMSF